MKELRDVYPVHVVYGGFLRSDNAGVGVVVGGAPVWDLVSQAIRSQRGRHYHQMLMTLDNELHVFFTNEPVDLSDPMMTFLHAQARVTHSMQARILGEFADSLTDATLPGGIHDGVQVVHSVSRVTQVLWELPVLPASLGGLPRLAGNKDGGLVQRQAAVVRSAVQRARAWVDMLGLLGGSPYARLLSSDELVERFYSSADPQRKRLFPLEGSIAGRVRPVIDAIAWPEVFEPQTAEEGAHDHS
jgi:hypothetical protein